MQVVILQEITLTHHEVVQYSKQCTQEPSSSCNWAEASNDHDLEEKFEMYSQESRNELEVS